MLVLRKAVCSWACVMGVAGALAEPPVVRWIGPPAGYPDSFGTRMSADGSTVLVLAGTLNTEAQTVCGLWTETGGVAWLPMPEDAIMWNAYGLSGSGERILAGMIGGAAQPIRTWTAADGWTALGGFTHMLELFHSSRTGEAAIVIDDGVWSVWSDHLPTKPLRSNAEDLISARGLNADGSVVVGWYNGHAARWTREGGWGSLATGGFEGYAEGLLCSDSGATIVGTGRMTAQDRFDRLWWWEEARGRIEWLTASGYDMPWPIAMSGNGSVVVGYSAASAFVCTRANGVVDLNQYLSAVGADTQGHWLRMAAAVSDDGRTIVGTGFRNITDVLLQAEAFVVQISLCPADIGVRGGVPGADGLLDNNDFVVFVDKFFSVHPQADRGGAGGVEAPDGVFDNNDFVVFIEQFFVGC